MPPLVVPVSLSLKALEVLAVCCIHSLAHTDTMRPPVLLLFTVVSAAALSCDPVTQYEENNEHCCQKCAPGTSMLHTNHQDSCTNPNCQPCADNEYQDRYTTERNCKLQPYCDPNKNFGVVIHMNKTSQSRCICKRGYHCSSQTCITCAPHSPCPPGYGVWSKGNHSHDTRCHKCPPGKFSNESSKDAVCREWTVCVDGSYVKMEGTDKSDNICGGWRMHYIAYIIPICLLLPLVIAFGIYKAKGVAEEQVKKCAIFCPEEPEPMQLERTNQQEDVCCELGQKTPEENENLLEESPTHPLILDNVNFTVNGNLVVKEDGRTSPASEITNTFNSYIA